MSCQVIILPEGIWPKVISVYSVLRGVSLLETFALMPLLTVNNILLNGTLDFDKKKFRKKLRLSADFFGNKFTVSGRVFYCSVVNNIYHAFSGF